MEKGKLPVEYETKTLEDIDVEDLDRLFAQMIKGSYSVCIFFCVLL